MVKGGPDEPGSSKVTVIEHGIAAFTTVEVALYQFGVDKTATDKRRTGEHRSPNVGVIERGADDAAEVKKTEIDHGIADYAVLEDGLVEGAAQKGLPGQIQITECQPVVRGITHGVERLERFNGADGCGLGIGMMVKAEVA